LKKYLAIVLFQAFWFVSLGQIMPLIDGNKWVLKEGERRTMLPSSIHYVHSFDEQETAKVRTASGIALILKTGEIVLETRKNLDPIGFGHYIKGFDTLVFIHNNEVFQEKIKNFKKHEGNWISYQNDSMLINKNLKQQISIATKGLNFFSAMDEYLVLQQDQMFFLYTSKGELLDSIFNMYRQFRFISGQGIIQLKDPADLLIWHSNAMSLFLLDGRLISLPNDMDGFQINMDNTLAVCGNRKCSIYELEQGTQLFSTKADKINSCSKGLYTYTLDGKSGLIDKTGKILLPAKYDFLSLRNHYISVSNNRLTGILNKEFKEVVPCRYSRIQVGVNYYRTQLHQFHGLISRRNNKELLKPVYDQIVISENKIRAWSGSTMLILEIDSNHNVVNEIALTNVIPINIPLFIDAEDVYDPRLLEIGWFLEPSEIEDDKGNVKQVVRFGLKNETDSVIYTPKSSTPHYLHQAPFSLIVTKPANKQEPQILSPVFLESGRVNPKIAIREIDTSDFQYRGYARYVDNKEQFLIINSQGVTRQFEHIEPTKNEFLRVCKSGQTKPTNDCKEGMECSKFARVGFNQRQVYNARYIGKNLNTYYTVEDGLWNYLDQDGNDLFEQDFLYAEPFLKGTAIVRTETGYGVISKDSFLIAPIYSSIQRLAEYSDTLFMVKKLIGGSRYYDMEINELVHLRGISTRKGDLVKIHTPKESVIINQQGEIIASNDYDFQLFEQDVYVKKEQKEYVIYNKSGNEIGISVLKPKRFIAEDTFLFRDKMKNGLTNLHNDTLIPALYSDIVELGSFLIGENGSKSTAYTADFKQITNDTRILLYDYVYDQIVYFNDKKYIVVDAQGNTVKSLKLDSPPVGFHNGHLFLRNQKIINLDGKIIEHELPVWHSVVSSSPDLFILYNKSREELIYSNAWNELGSKHAKKKKIQFITNDILGFRSIGNNYLMNVKTGNTINVVEYDEGFSEGTILIQETGYDRQPRYSYIDEKLDPIFNQKFLDAKPFKNGWAAVRYETGWTLINKAGELKFVPMLNQIELLTDNILEINQGKLYGVMSHSGRTIFPVAFDYLEINHNLVRMHRKNELMYRKKENV
jgi:hypothetical protein